MNQLSRNINELELSLRQLDGSRGFLEQWLLTFMKNTKEDDLDLDFGTSNFGPQALLVNMKENLKNAFKFLENIQKLEVMNLPD